MKIQNLIDNLAGALGCQAEHGLCYCIETKNHKLLLDTGASGVFAENAERLGVDLKDVDLVVLSHGHYDHGGGLQRFFGVNDRAKVYMQKTAFGAHYAVHADGPRYIGLAKELLDSGRIIWVSGNRKIDDELSLFAGIRYYEPLENGPESLKIQTEEGLIPDDFRHEQCLVITQDGKTCLFSGCAHHGILNIMKSFRETFGQDPDAVFSGFHLRKRNGYSDEDLCRIVEVAKGLKEYKTAYYTGHCTGIGPYRIMKEIMGDQLTYVACGDTVLIG